MRSTLTLVLCASLGLASCESSSKDAKSDAAAAKAEPAKKESAKEEAEEQELDARDLAAEAKIRLSQALATALAAKPGEAVAAELEGDVVGGKRTAAYEVAIVDAAGVVGVVKVDHVTGQVESVAKEDEADEAQEFAEKREAAGADHLSLAELLLRGAKAGKGTPVEVAFRGKKHAGQARVELVDGREKSSVTLDAKTGKVLETK